MWFGGSRAEVMMIVGGWGCYIFGFLHLPQLVLVDIEFDREYMVTGSKIGINYFSFAELW